MNGVYLKRTEMLTYLCETAGAVGVRSVSVIWEVAGVRLTEAFLEMGLYKEPLVCAVTLSGDRFGSVGHPATIRGRHALVGVFPKEADWRWLTSVIGGNPFPALAGATEAAGHVVIGVADHPFKELGFPLNAELVARVVEFVRSKGREVATAAETREMLGLTGGEG